MAHPAVYCLPRLQNYYRMLCTLWSSHGYPYYWRYQNWQQLCSCSMQHCGHVIPWYVANFTYAMPHGLRTLGINYQGFPIFNVTQKSSTNIILCISDLDSVFSQMWWHGGIMLWRNVLPGCITIHACFSSSVEGFLCFLRPVVHHIVLSYDIPLWNEDYALEGRDIS